MINIPDDYDPFAYYYDQEYREVTGDIEMYNEMAKRAGARAHLLELACGGGRVTLPLLEAGFRVTGLDKSDGMLAIARQKLAALPPDVQSRARFLKADMRGFNLGNDKFDLIFVALNSFQHLLTQEDQLACLTSARRHLAPMGRFVVDVYNPEEKESYPADGRVEFNTSFSNEITGNTVQVFLSTTALPHLQQRRYLYFYDEIAADGTVKRTTANLTLRYTYRYEMELLLEKAGFVIEDFYGGYDYEEYGAGSGKLIYICRNSG